MKKPIKSLLSRIIVFSLIIQLAGCGTFIYPERQGQPKGDIDPTVAILNGVGLLFFVIPGLVSFIIDFHTGAIYLPPGKSTEQRLRELKGSGIDFLNSDKKIVIHFDPASMPPEKLKQIITKATGVDFDSNNPELEVYKIDKNSKFYSQFEYFAANKGGSALVIN